jgi:uncharacterized membrane protein
MSNTMANGLRACKHIDKHGTMKLILYLLTLLIHTGMIWLWYMLVARNVDGQQPMDFMAGNLSPVVAGVLYLLYVAGLFYFAVGLPLRQRVGAVGQAAFNGAFFGIMGPAASLWTNITSHHLPAWFIAAEFIYWPTFIATTATVMVWIGKKWEEKMKSQNHASLV